MVSGNNNGDIPSHPLPPAYYDLLPVSIMSCFVITIRFFVTLRRERYQYALRWTYIEIVVEIGMRERDTCANIAIKRYWNRSSIANIYFYESIYRSNLRN